MAGQITLFTPWGNGNGHLMRCVVLAQAARDAGDPVAIAVPDARQRAFVESAGLRAVPYEGDWSQHDPWMMWTDETVVRSAIAADRALLRSTRAARVVVDSRISMNVAAHLEDVPVVGLVQDMDFPGHTYPGRPTEALWPRGAAAFRRALADHGPVDDLTDLRQVIVASPVAVPGIPETDPVPAEALGYTTYVGPLTGVDRADAGHPLPDDAILFYKTFTQVERAHELVDAFGDVRDRVHVATGDERSAAALRAEPLLAGFAVRDLWAVRPGAGAGPRTAVVHGGHGVVLTMLQAGTPTVVVVDGSPERAANAVKARAFGSFAAVGEPAEVDWSAQAGHGHDTPFTTVRDAVDQLEADPGAALAAERWRRHLETFTLDGARTTIREHAAVPHLWRSTTTAAARA